MGVVCKVSLPPAVRVRDVADVLAILTGAPVRKHIHDKDTWWAKVDGIKFDTTPGLEDCVNITWVSKAGRYRMLYHFEFGDKGERGIICRSYADRIALFKGLVDFFGGSVDYNGSDNEDKDYRRPAKKDIHAEGGELWVGLQQRKLDLKPLSRRHIRACEKFAAYPNDPEPMDDVADLVEEAVG